MKIHTSIVALAFSAGACFAQQADEQAIDRMFAHYEQLAGCSVGLGVRVTSDNPAFAPMVEGMSFSNPGYVVKPNRYAFWSEDGAETPAGGFPTVAIYSDGSVVTSALAEFDAYAQEDATEDTGALIADEVSGMRQGWQMVPGANLLLALMAPDPRAAFVTQLEGFHYEGLVGEGEDAYHAYSALSEGESLTIRIAATGDPWLIALEPDMSQTGAPPGIEVVIAFADWAAIDDAPEEGRLAVAEGWEKVDSISEAMMLGMAQAESGAQGAPEGQMNSIDAGDEAPNFTLPMLGSESEFALADHRGKVVVLDFWATWCAPCVAGLPTVSGVTADLAEKGVVFAAVNLQEDAETVSAFMQKKGWDFTVAMDGNGAIAAEYGVSGIPHSVVIDKNGIVRHVHIGFDASNPEAAGEHLRSELEALIAE